jgi:DNA-binding beta-propeller fold protein YncE
MRTTSMAKYLVAAALSLAAFALASASTKPPMPPQFEIDTTWPKPLPGQWILGQVTGVAVDRQNRIWVLNRPASISEDDGVTGAVAAPPLLVFDQQGALVAHWPVGTRGETWPHREHSIAIDPSDGSVWISGNGDDDGFIVKYTADGHFLLRIGSSGPSRGSNDIGQLGRASGLVVDPESDELFVADGYANRRIIVFDTRTGAYKRHWGAYGRQPIDGPMSDRASQLMQPHGIALSRDGVIYVGDRPNNRIQAFSRDGRWLLDIVQRPETGGGTGGKSGSVGSVWDAALWPRDENEKLLVLDGSNSEVRITDRDTRAVTGQFGRTGPYPGEFRWAHTIAVDAAGNVYVGEVSNGKRVQRFRPTHPVPSSDQR